MLRRVYFFKMTQREQRISIIDGPIHLSPVTNRTGIELQKLKRMGKEKEREIQDQHPEESQPDRSA
jgi:hypothetical protein